MYKDKDKQREANRQASQRRRDRKGMTNEGMTPQGMTHDDVKNEIVSDADYARITKGTEVIMPKRTPKRGKDIKYFADLPPDVQKHINETSRDKGEHTRLTGAAINYQHQFPDSYGSGLCLVNVTGKPGDADYNGVCTEAWRAERGR